MLRDSLEKNKREWKDFFIWDWKVKDMLELKQWLSSQNDTCKQLSVDQVGVG